MTGNQRLIEWPIPAHFDPYKVAEVWKVPYQQRAQEAQEWAARHEILPATTDSFKISLLCIDVQNTFCHPDFELYVGGRSGTGAVDDNRRLAQFIYRNLGRISEISATLDTHQAVQIFHAIYLVNERGEHPQPHTTISLADIQKGRWKFNPLLADNLGISADYGQQELLHYVNALKTKQKYELTIWPYHAMLGGIGHALVSSIEEALFFHTIARKTQTDFILKGDNPLTESYSAIGPEVTEGPGGEQIGRKSGEIFEKLLHSDALIIAGEAKSHCVAWTVEDLLADIQSQDAGLAKKVYLLEDCTSPVVVPGALDFSAQADAAYERFAQAGMHLVRSSDPIQNWLEQN